MPFHNYVLEDTYDDEDYCIIPTPIRQTEDAFSRKLRQEKAEWEREAPAWEREAILRGLQTNPLPRPSLGRGAALLRCLYRVGMGPGLSELSVQVPEMENEQRRFDLTPEAVMDSPGSSEHGGLGRAVGRVRDGSSRDSSISEIDKQILELEASLGAVASIEEGGAYAMPDVLSVRNEEGCAFNVPEVDMCSVELSEQQVQDVINVQHVQAPALVLPEGEQDMSIGDEAQVSGQAPSRPEAEDEWSQRLLQDRKAFIAANGVPRVVLILCSLFWKLEFLKICNLLSGPEAPPNDDRFCRQVAEKVYRNCCRPGEKLAAESRVTIHAVDVVKQTLDQIIQTVEQYGRAYTHVIIIPNTFHFWDLMEQDLGDDAPKYMNEITHQYVNLGACFMRQGMAREVLLLPFLPMGNPTCGLIPRVNISGIWNELVESCNVNNENIDVMLKHMWTKELAQKTMNVPNSVAWNIFPLEAPALWQVYVNHFIDRYEKRRPIALPCGATHRSGSHYLLHELWGLVQDNMATCICEMTVKIMRPIRKRNRRRRSQNDKS